MSHTLEKLGPKRYRCTVCHQEWQSQAKSYCPRIPVISFGDRGPLRSKTELDKLGYKTDNLPRAEVCYRMVDGRNDVMYVKLYDPATLPRKRQNPRREVHYVEVLYWPVAWMDVFASLHELGEMMADGEAMPHREWLECIRPVGQMASTLLVFTREEIERMAGEVIAFRLPVLPVRTRWPNVGTANTQLEALYNRLKNEYLNWRYPPWTDEQWKAHRLETEEKNRRAWEFTYKEHLERQGWAGVTRPTDDYALPVQRSLFKEDTHD